MESRRGETRRTQLWPTPEQPLACVHKTVSLLVLSPRIQCLRQSHTAGSPRTGPCLPSAACAAEQALGARLLSPPFCTLRYHTVWALIRVILSVPGQRGLSQPQSSYPAALQPCPRVGAAAPLDLARTISPFTPDALPTSWPQSLPLPLCLFFL